MYEEGYILSEIFNATEGLSGLCPAAGKDAVNYMRVMVNSRLSGYPLSYYGDTSWTRDQPIFGPVPE